MHVESSATICELLGRTCPSSDKHTSLAAASAAQIPVTACLLNTLFSASNRRTKKPPAAAAITGDMPPAAVLAKQLCSSRTPFSRPRNTRVAFCRTDTDVIRCWSRRWWIRERVKAVRVASDCMVLLLLVEVGVCVPCRSRRWRI